jgi:hypothetical protein
MFDEPDQDEPLFPLVGDIERPAIQEIIKGVRILFCRKDITAQQLHNLALLLFGLQALPSPTAGLNVTLILSCTSGDDMHYHSVNLTDETFELSTGGHIYTPGAGHDSYSQTALMVETTGYRDANEAEIAKWIIGFKQRTIDGDIRVDLEEDCAIDWTVEPDESGWDRAAERYANRMVKGILVGGEQES